jgi:anthranilate 1,2-dioxygenase ferredoxin subunit
MGVSMPAMSSAPAVWHTVGAPADFPEGAGSCVIAAGRRIAVFHVDAEWFALDDECTHGHAQLSEGYLENGCVECPLHQGLFDLRTGLPRGGVVTESVRAYSVRIEAGYVEVLA